MELEAFVRGMASVFEAAGAVTMVVGAIVSVPLSWSASRRAREEERLATLYRGYRQQLGRSIILGLELLVAADILRTVAEIPTVRKVLILAAIVLIRTFLSFSLEVELEGRWPWQRARSG